MIKLNDNELISIWNESIDNINNSNNEFFQKKYLNLTSYIDIKNGKIINTHELNNNRFISFIHKNLEQSIIYTFVIFNNSDDLPPEKSPIEKYCLFQCEYFDIFDNIISYKINSYINAINLSIDKKFDSLLNNNFKVMKCKLDKKELVDVVIKPSKPIKIPSISNILSNILPKKKEIVEEEKHDNKISNIFKNTNLISKNEIFNNEESIILEQSNFDNIIMENEIVFPKEEINIKH